MFRHAKFRITCFLVSSPLLKTILNIDLKESSKEWLISQLCQNYSPKVHFDTKKLRAWDLKQVWIWSISQEATFIKLMSLINTFPRFSLRDKSASGIADIEMNYYVSIRKGVHWGKNKRPREGESRIQRIMPKKKINLQRIRNWSIVQSFCSGVLR